MGRFVLHCITNRGFRGGIISKSFIYMLLYIIIIMAKKLMTVRIEEDILDRLNKYVTIRNLNRSAVIRTAIAKRLKEVA